MTKRKLSLYVCAGAFGAVLLILWAHQQSSLNNSLSQAGFEFDTKVEKRYDGIAGPMWQIRVMLPKQNYSKDRLESLFRYFSDKHSNTEERLHVEVYTEIMNLESGPGIPEDVSFPSNKDNASKPQDHLVRWDAIFYRQGDGAASGGGDNEWYLYKPDLDNPSEIRSVVLKGRDPFANNDAIKRQQGVK
jgi:hypothetical protein